MDLTLIFSAVASAVALGGSWYVSRRYSQMGGGEAQLKLNKVLKELADASEEKIGHLSTELTTTQVRVADLEREVADVRRERRELGLEISGLQDELRQARRLAIELTAETAALRVELTAAKKRAGEAEAK